MTQSALIFFSFAFVFYILLPVIQNYRFRDTGSSSKQTRINNKVLRTKLFLIYFTNDMEHSYLKSTNSFKDNQTFKAFYTTRAFITILLIHNYCTTRPASWLGGQSS